MFWMNFTKVKQVLERLYLPFYRCEAHRFILLDIMLLFMRFHFNKSSNYSFLPAYEGAEFNQLTVIP